MKDRVETAVFDYVEEFAKLLDVSRQGLTGVDIENRLLLGAAPLQVLANAVEYYDSLGIDFDDEFSTFYTLGSSTDDE